MTIKDLEALEARIAKAKEDYARAQGALEQTRAQAEKEFGVTTIQEAEAKEAEITEQAAALSKKLETDYQLLLADVEAAGA